MVHRDASPSVLIAPGEDFHHASYEALRPMAQRLGFFIACIPVLTFLPHWVLEPETPMRLLPFRIAAQVLGLIYPMALKLRAPRRWIPWLLYGPATLLALLMLWGLADVEANGFRNAWILLYPFIFNPVLGMPLRRGENVLGILALFLSPNLAMLAWPDLRGLVIQLDIMALPVVGASLYIQTLFTELLMANHAYQLQIEALAHRDALTGAFNRRYFMEAAELLLKRAQRTGHPICLLILDIDHFKGVNDRFGHPVGDLVIQATAATIQGTLRETDLVARFGGEEFVALLPDSDEGTAGLAAERVRAALELTAVALEERADPVRFTASIGLSRKRAKGDSLGALLERADAALYQAKRSGRNQVIVDRSGG